MRVGTVRGNRTAMHAFGSALLLLLGVLSIAGRARADEPLLINGAGATFPYPLYSKWFKLYRSVDPTVEFNYQSIGSGGGIRQLLDRTIDFGASDAPMKDEQLAKAPMKVFHFPTVLGAVVLTYNLPGLQGELKLTPELVIDLFMGRIQKWNDPRIAKVNPELRLPGLPVFITYRSDGSGTTSIFTGYLSKISEEWKQKVGAGPAVRWPTGIGGKGNEGVTGWLKQAPGSFGYVELVYAISNKLSYATLRNQAGRFVKPSPDSVTAAAAGAMRAIPEDFRMSLTNAEGEASYPIAGFTYLLSYEKMPRAKQQAFTRFLTWALDEGQKIAQPMGYAPLPRELVPRVRAQISRILPE